MEVVQSSSVFVVPKFARHNSFVLCMYLSFWYISIFGPFELFLVTWNQITPVVLNFFRCNSTSSVQLTCSALFVFFWLKSVQKLKSIWCIQFFCFIQYLRSKNKQTRPRHIISPNKLNNKEFFRIIEDFTEPISMGPTLFNCTGTLVCSLKIITMMDENKWGLPPKIPCIYPPYHALQREQPPHPTKHWQ